MKTCKVLPKMAESLPVLSGSVCAQFVRCGRANCGCKVGGAALHGPYFYHFFREDGRQRKRYLKPDEVEATREACERGAQIKKQRASFRAAHRAGVPSSMKDLLRDIEAMFP